MGQRGVGGDLGPAVERGLDRAAVAAGPALEHLDLAAGRVLKHDLDGRGAGQGALVGLLEAGQADGSTRPVGHPVLAQHAGRLGADGAGDDGGDAVEQPLHAVVHDQRARHLGQPVPQPSVGGRAHPDQAQEGGGRRGDDLPVHLAGGADAGDGGQRVGGRARAGELVGPDAQHDDPRGADQRAPVGVLERGAAGHAGQHGQPVAGLEAGHDDRRAPQHLPGAVNHAHAEAAPVLPAQPAAAEVDRGAEPGPGRRAMLGDPGHLEDQVTGVQLPVGPVQGVGDGLLAAGGQRGRGLVLPLLPGQQELLHGGLGRWRAALDQAEADDAEDHDDGSQLAERGSRQSCHPASPDLSVRVTGPGPHPVPRGPLPRGFPRRRPWPGRRARSTMSGGVRTAATRARHHPPLRYLRRRKARSTSLAASLSARS